MLYSKDKIKSKGNIGKKWKIMIKYYIGGE